MIIRSIPRCTATRRLQASRTLHVKQRKYSTSSPSLASTASPPASMLGAFTNELDKIAPKFEIYGSQVRILRSPSDFYETLKISTLQQALRAKPKLKLSILTDALRGTRESPDPSCASLLAPLVSEFGADRVEIRMYHTPNLTGLRKKYIPKRINEGWGLQHMKLYGTDDEIIISGANLSNDYFTNRQDRYHVFSSAEITSYFSKLHDAVSSLSFLVNPDPQLPAGYTLSWPSSNTALSPLEDPKKYITQAAKILTPLIQPEVSSSTSPTSPLRIEKQPNTIIYPLSQLTPLLPPSADTSTELPSITHILRTLSSSSYRNSTWTFTAGYFNPLPSLTTLLLSASSRSGTVITASPHANGFYNSPGISGLLPSAYTLLSRRFLERVENSHCSPSNPFGAAFAGDGIVLKEWRRGTVGEPGGWTYHAKGLWVSLDGEKGSSLSVVGSSNYTKRSYSLDLETGVCILTSDEGLRRRLGEERDGLQDFAEGVGMDDFIKTERRVGIKVRIAMWIVALVGGAL
ncbi:Phosphatidylglycerophosphate synthase [Hyphodiscus hymeniophilus]|uniref:CDP-diacylglycerol--glycerol-3-phosphate 3-phosphatidyltransferase n=1 Tax=Hyphodiscus hymeniophilus TaxID=353542 RepID=A0A9P7AWZ9_9HELO|nr:Phosphatidylglycerophosphate synthase [Hyphodiscus hymeniophilus]